MRVSKSETALNGIRHVTLNVNGKPKTFDVVKELRLARDSGSDTLDSHTLRYAFWRRMLLECRRKRRKIQNRLEVVRDELTLQYRLAYSKVRFTYKTTDMDIRAEVNTHERIGKGQIALENAMHAEDICAMMVDAMEHRKSVILKSHWS